MTNGCGSVSEATPRAMADGYAPALPHMTPPDRQAWILVSMLSLIAFAIIGGTLTSLSVYLPVLQHEFGWSEAAMGGLPVAMLLGMSGGNLLVGRLISLLNIRGTIVIGVMTTAIGWAVASQATSLPFFMGAMAIAGCGSGIATIVPGLAAITRRFETQRGLAIGVFIGACALAGSAVPPLSGWLITAYGWRATFFLVGAAMATIGLPLAALVKISREATSADHGTTGHLSNGDTGPTASDVAKWPAYWRLAAALTLSQLCMNGILFSTVAFFLRNGFAQEHAVAIYSATNLLALSGLLAGGALADRYGARAALPGALLLQAMGTLCLLGINGANLGGSGPAIGGFILLWGLAGGLPSQIGPMLLADLIGARAFATMLGVTLTIAGLLGALAPAATGWLYEIRGSYALPITIWGLLAVLAALLTLRVKQRN